MAATRCVNYRWLSPRIMHPPGPAQLHNQAAPTCIAAFRGTLTGECGPNHLGAGAQLGSEGVRPVHELRAGTKSWKVGFGAVGDGVDGRIPLFRITAPGVGPEGWGSLGRRPPCGSSRQGQFGAAPPAQAYP